MHPARLFTTLVLACVVAVGALLAAARPAMALPAKTPAWHVPDAPLAAARALPGTPVAVAGLAQVDDEEPQSQDATSDGTLPYRLLAISMAGLAGLLGVLTFWYWKATTPPARRGYLPPSDDRFRDRLGTRPPIDRVMEVDVARESANDAVEDEADPTVGEGPIIDFPL